MHLVVAYVSPSALKAKLKEEQKAKEKAEKVALCA